MVVLPPAPVLIPGLTGSAEPELAELRRSLDAALHRALHPFDTPPAVVVVSADLARSPSEASSRGWAGPVSTADFGVNLRFPAIGGHEGTDVMPERRDLPTSVMVLRGILASCGSGLLGRARWAQMQPAQRRGPRPPAAAGGQDAPNNHGAPEDPAVLVVLADGAAGYGTHGPLAPDPRAATFDARLRAALASGRPGLLADSDNGDAGDLLATPADTWQRVTTLLEGSSGASTWAAQLHYFAHPYGVTLPVASWVAKA